MSKARRRLKAIKRQRGVHQHPGVTPPCMHCGEMGRHFVGPSFGDAGFWTCDPPVVIPPSRPWEHYPSPAP